MARGFLFFGTLAIAGSLVTLGTPPGTCCNGSLPRQQNAGTRSLEANRTGERARNYSNKSVLPVTAFVGVR